jgi:enoyl-CoA hydratase/carnithine racemase
MTAPVHTSVSDGVRTITLDRPPGNAVDQELMVGLLEILQTANHDWDTRVIVIESALPEVFSTGADADAPRPAPKEPYDSFGVPSTAMALVRHALRGVWDAKWPVIAKVRGVAAGDGLLLAALADVMVVSETARLGLPGARREVVSGASILRRCMPEQAMRYLILSARLVEARELRALGAGLVVVPEAELDARTAALARDVASHDPHLLRYLKVALTEGEPGDPLGGHAIEQRYTALLEGKART